MKTVTLCAALLTLISATINTSQAAQADPDKWQFKITPYLWIATIKGNTGSDGGDIDFDTDYNFLSLDNLDGAFFIAASASKGRWTWQTDIVYLNFNDNITLGPIDTGIDLTGDIIELSAGYKPASFEHTEILFGARRVALDLDISLTPGPQTSGGQSWLDPIVGLRHIRPLGERWQAIGRIDVGGFRHFFGPDVECAGRRQFQYDPPFVTIFRLSLSPARFCRRRYAGGPDRRRPGTGRRI